MESTFDRSYTNNILPEKLKNYMNELESDTLLTEINVHDKALLKSGIAAKWTRYLYEEEKYKRKMNEAIDELKNRVAENLFEKKKNAIANQTISEAMIKLETTRVLNKTPQYLKIKQELDDQDDVIRLINDARQIISQLGFDIKNAIDVLKLENI